VAAGAHDLGELVHWVKSVQSVQSDAAWWDEYFGRDFVKIGWKLSEIWGFFVIFGFWEKKNWTRLEFAKKKLKRWCLGKGFACSDGKNGTIGCSVMGRVFGWWFRRDWVRIEQVMGFFVIFWFFVNFLFWTRLEFVKKKWKGDVWAMGSHAAI
jgi:hypothetical protein